MKKYILALAVLVAGVSQAQSLQEVDDFNRVMIDTDAQVEIVKSTKSQVMMSLSEEETADITVTSKNGSLVIKQLGNKKHKNLKIRIYTNSVNALSVKGSTDVALKNFTFQDAMIVQTKGDSNVDLGDLQVKKLKVLRTSNSSVIAKNATKTEETVDGVTVAMN